MGSNPIVSTERLGWSDGVPAGPLVGRVVRLLGCMSEVVEVHAGGKPGSVSRPTPDPRPVGSGWCPVTLAREQGRVRVGADEEVKPRVLLQWLQTSLAAKTDATVQSVSNSSTT